MRKILPIQAPKVDNYPLYAAVLASMSPHTTHTGDWAYSYFIQLEMVPNHENKMRIDLEVPYPWFCCPWLNYYKLPRDMIQHHWTSVLDFVVDMINRDRYALCLVDTYYIELNREDGSEPMHFLHELFIYGYDLDKGELYVGDNFPAYHGKYTLTTCPIEEFRAAYKGVPTSGMIDWVQGVHVFSYNKLYNYGFYDLRPQFEFSYNIPLIRGQIEDFLECRPTQERWQYPKTWRKSEEHCWGRDVYGYLLDHLELIRRGEYTMDRRGFSVLLTHKTLMEERMVRLAELGYLELEESALVRLREVKHMAEVLCNLALKYSITQRPAILDKIAGELRRLDQVESETLRGLLPKLHDRPVEK